MSNSIEAIESVEEKRANRIEQWEKYIEQSDLDFEEADRIRSSPFESSDSIESLANDPVPPQQKNELGQPNSNFLVDVGNQIWSFFSNIFSMGSSATGTTGKPGGDSIGQPIGAPSLETPAQMDLRECYKLLEEMKKMLEMVKETSGEALDDLKKDEKETSYRLLIVYLKNQKEVREESVRNQSFQFVFHQKWNQALNRDYGNMQDQQVELSRKIVFWGNINKGLSIATIAVSVSFVAIGAFSTMNAAALPVVFKLGMVATQTSLTVATALTELMKTTMGWKTNDITGKSGVLRQRHQTLQVLITDDSKKLNSGLQQSLEIVKMLSNLEKQRRRACHSMTV